MSKETNEIRPPVKVVEWLGPAGGGRLRLLDQTRLPAETEFLDCRDAETVHDAIRRLVVRGAPAIGVAAGYGMVLAGSNLEGGDDFLDRLERACEYLESARPTAVNLSWAVRRVHRRARGGGTNRGEVLSGMLAEARDIQAEDEQLCQAIGRHAGPLVRKCSGLLTHCNAGALATAGIGTATAGMYVAHAAGCDFVVYCDETRPLLQGSRLTAWELQQAGIKAVVITDNMAGQIMKEGKVQMIITGADRIAANGDAANKIGTYSLAVLAAYHKIPFYVAAPYSSFDLDLENGEKIPIEQRADEEITEGLGRRTAPVGISTYSPAFDVTPAELITALITDRGVISPVSEQVIRRMISS